MDISSLGVTELLEAFSSGKLTSAAAVDALKDTYDGDCGAEKPLNGYVEWFDDAQAAAAAADEKRKTDASASDTQPLLGVPFAVKDNISIKGKSCTCGSNLLKGYTAPYTATIVQRLLDAGAIPVGRTNMDEFAMGSSTEYSAYGPSRNPVNRDYAPGGSSGGSAAVVAGNQAPFALGTETGGSVRLPASYCGVYGLKPTYGSLSRWGITSFGSSLDQAGIMGRSPRDIALPLSVMAGVDPYDDTSADLDVSNLKNLKAREISGLRVAVPKQFEEAKGLDSEVAAVFESAKKWFRERGAIVETVDIPILDASVASYYVIALSEAASNLARFDGIRFGQRRDPGEGFDALFTATRSEGFGAEVKRRIIIGNYALSTTFSGDCYKKALSVRARIQREISAVLSDRDIILCPTAPAPAFKLGEKVNDPLAMYLSDMFTVFVNLARIPSISVPADRALAGKTAAGKTATGLPIGIQFAGKHFSESAILGIAQAWEESAK
ncbi:MAG: Asp-tRNA(Asn)/Glu-tRNA(Gln) amidotransferase subunit GatA [Spirochaetaceae bacterium]|jgi:aspartyl-tRNA(Asn)/glutamyl-tRNA(Gln) amidotransferase subunit A|nr:Asp-tRNA(Asn)/Glu-tRNA(Gln) amidotransferase subunit GatA [Spirochaetaceae bacterium]